MQKQKFKISIVALVAVYCILIGGGVIWQNFEVEGSQLGAVFMAAETTTADETVDKVSTKVDRTVNKRIAAIGGTSATTQAELTAAMEKAAALKAEADGYMKGYQKAEWCTNNKEKCAMEQITLPPAYQAEVSRAEEASDYAKTILAIPWFFQEGIKAKKAETAAKIAEVEFMEKNNIPIPPATLAEIGALSAEINDLEEEADDTTAQLIDVKNDATCSGESAICKPGEKSEKEICADDCLSWKVEEKIETASLRPVSTSTIATMNNTSAEKETTKIISNPTLIARNSNKNKIVVSTPRKNNSPFAANILATSSVKTPAATTTTTNKIATATTTPPITPTSSSEYADALADLKKLEEQLDGIADEVDSAAEEAVAALDKQEEEMQEDFKQEQIENETKLAEAKAAAAAIETPSTEMKPIAIGLSNYDKDGNKIYDDYDDVIPITPVLDDEDFSLTNSILLPTWDYSKAVFEP